MTSSVRTFAALTLAGTALLAATAIYATARAGFRLHGWLRALDLQPGTTDLPAFVRYNLPDALWQYAFTVCVLAIWRTGPRSPRMWSWIALPLAIGLSSEFGQALGLVQGVFDPLDAAAMTLAAGAAAVTVGLPTPARHVRAPASLEAHASGWRARAR